MATKFTGSINLTKLKHWIVKQKRKDGNMMKLLVIPLDEYDENDLVKGEGDTYYLNIRIYVRDEADKHNNHGFVSASVSSKKWEAATPEEKDRLIKEKPILGNIRNWDKPQNDGAMSNFDNQIIPEFETNGEAGGDLPF